MDFRKNSRKIRIKKLFVPPISLSFFSYFNNGLIIPESYKKATNDLCDENDKMKQFIENQFEITKRDEDRITKDEFHELYSTHTKCNYAWTSILSDIKRLGLCYDGGKRSVYKGITIRGVLVGIKKKILDPFIETSELDIQDTKDAEIKALKKEIEELKKQLIKQRDPIDIISSEQEVIIQKEEIMQDPYIIIMKDLKDQEEWMADYVRQTKPKKKINKKQIRRDIFEIDFMCD